MTKEQIIRKLTSRKFWVAIVGFVTALITVFNVESIDSEQVTVLIMAFGTLIAYIVGEGLVDAISSKTTIEYVEDVETTNPIGFVDTTDVGVDEDA